MCTVCDTFMIYYRYKKPQSQLPQKKSYTNRNSVTGDNMEKKINPIAEQSKQWIMEAMINLQKTPFRLTL